MNPNQTTHQNSQILANNLNLTSKGDTNIIGGNLSANNVMMNVGGNLVMETVQDTEEWSGSSFGISGGYNQKGSFPKKPSNVTLSASINDGFKSYTTEKTDIDADSLTLNVGGDVTDLTEKADRQFVNGDFEGSLAIDMRLFSKEGRGEIGKQITAYQRAFNKDQALKYSAKATDSYDNVIIKQRADIIMSNSNSTEEEMQYAVNILSQLANKNLPSIPDQYAHENAAKAWGAYVNDPGAAMIARFLGEFGYQYPKYSLKYNQQDPINSLYDPMGMYNPNLPYSEFKPDLTGKGYFKDSLQDIKNSINGSLDVKNNNNR